MKHPKFNLVIFILLFLTFSACKVDQHSKLDTKSNALVDELLSTNSQSDTISDHVFDHGREETIEIDDVDHKFLNFLVFNGINDVREKVGLKPLLISGVLIAAAENQTKYQINISRLSHFQEEEELKSAMMRVRYYGGVYRSIGENVQYQGFTIRTYNNKEEIITTSYGEAANKIIDGWVNSPGHYRNIVNPDFDYVGTSVLYSPKKKALFATQVYGTF